MNHFEKPVDAIDGESLLKKIDASTDGSKNAFAQLNLKFTEYNPENNPMELIGRIPSSEQGLEIINNIERLIRFYSNLLKVTAKTIETTERIEEIEREYMEILGSLSL